VGDIAALGEETGPVSRPTVRFLKRTPLTMMLFAQEGGFPDRVADLYARGLPLCDEWTRNATG
jgi:hypothetical protein